MMATSNTEMRELTIGEMNAVSGGFPIGPGIVIFAIGFAIGFTVTNAVMPLGDFPPDPKDTA
jgi:hypothetical protein